jgi:outer membrane protein assembly factor BamB
MSKTGKISNKLKATIIAFVFALTTAALAAGLPFVDALDINTNAYVSVSPNPVGANQTLLVTVWLVPSFSPTAYYHNYTVKFTKPDRTIDTIGPFDSNLGGTVGATSFNYVPDQVGTWYYEFSYLGGDIVDGNSYLASNSPVSGLTVQSEPIPQWPLAELPNEGGFSNWVRPINAWNRDWSMLGGDWPQNGYNASMAYFNPYSTMTDSAHILWTRQTSVAGLVGGEYGNASYSGGSSITMVLAGLAYYTSSDGTHCVDVHTGREVWVKPDTSPSVGAAIPEYSNTTGSSWMAELLQTGENFAKYDPFTGVATLTVPDALPGIYVEPYFYSVNNGRLITWKTNLNMSSGGLNSFKDLIVSNVSCNYDFSYAWDGIGVSVNPWPSESAAIDLTTGKTLWNMTIPIGESPLGAVCVADGKIFAAGEGMVFRAYNIYTGDKLWTSESAEYPWGAFCSNYTAYAYGNLYGLSYDGHIYCFDSNNGKIKWKFFSGNSSGETSSNTWSFSANPVVADGKIYASTGEYSHSEPLPRGNRLYCINATTGEKIWDIYFAGGAKVIADSLLLANNDYDGLLYCFGQGPTSVQISVSPTAVANGSSVFIEGFVLDQSPGQPGTPCISDENMTAYMQFLHMQQPCPSTIIGVPVELRAITSSGSIIEIVKTSTPTDLYGHFSYIWTPPSPGEYTIVARFLGTDSYFPSYQATGITVGSVSPTPTLENEPAGPDYTPIFAGIIAAIAVSIIIGLYNIYDRRKLRK